ncbi:MAG: alkaline phosphatase D family protein [Polyangiales bacterium]
MKLTRRELMQVAGAATLAGCASEVEVSDIDTFEDAGEDYDSGPDPTYDADPIDTDAGAVDLDASTDVDAALDAAPVETDAGAPADVTVERDAGSPPLDAGSPPRDAGSPPRDAGSPPRDAGPVVMGNPDFRRLPQRDGAFPLGVMAGDATDDSVMFWTRYDGDANLTLRVLEMDGDRVAAVRFNGRVTPSGAGYVRAIVNGLRPNRQHLYAFLVGPTADPNGRSPVGRVQTAIATDATANITFAGTACTNQNHRPFPVLVDAGGRTDLDFFIHAGDHTYTDHGAPADSLTRYRQKYFENWQSAGLRALHRSTGMYLTWDDHEVRNNWDPETISRARLSAARQAFFEHRATRKNASAPDRIWRKFRWGRTAEIFILDCRSERLPSTRSTNPARSSQYISRAQMNWLKSGLSSSPCAFKFIVNSVPIVNRPGGDGDNWNGYASQRRELLNHISNNNLRGVVFLSGDVHFGAVCKVEASGPWSNIWEVIMGPSGAYRDGRPPINASQFPVFVYNTHNYTVLRANPTTRTLSVEFINAAGNRIAGSAWSHRF